jgi:hypothetical protein
MILQTHCRGANVPMAAPLRTRRRFATCTPSKLVSATLPEKQDEGLDPIRVLKTLNGSRLPDILRIPAGVEGDAWHHRGPRSQT